MSTIHLAWAGPFGLASKEERTAFNPPRASGVYLWTVLVQDRYRISYVGETGNLEKRMYEHIFWTLGGAYCLYGDDHLIEGNKPVPFYQPGPRNLFERYLNEFDDLSKLALRNLSLYRFFWASVQDDRNIRKSVESALIRAARKNEDPVQNGPGRRSETSRRVRILSTFPNNVKIAAISSEMLFGSLDERAAVI